jgi:hypothetical protein
MAKILPLKSFRFLTLRTGFGNQVKLSGSIWAKVCNALELRYSQFPAKVRQLRGRHPRIHLPERISCWLRAFPRPLPRAGNRASSTTRLSIAIVAITTTCESRIRLVGS